MLHVLVDESKLDVYELNGNDECLMEDISVVADVVMRTLADMHTKTEEEFQFHYGLLARQLVNYIEANVLTIHEHFNKEE